VERKNLDAETKQVKGKCLEKIASARENSSGLQGVCIGRKKKKKMGVFRGKKGNGEGSRKENGSKGGICHDVEGGCWYKRMDRGRVKTRNPRKKRLTTNRPQKKRQANKHKEKRRTYDSRFRKKNRAPERWGVVNSPEGEKKGPGKVLV